MTCKQLGGACDREFHAKTFEKMAELSKKHAHEMQQKGDEAHIKEMKRMMNLMKDPNGMKAWMSSKKKEFDELPEE